MNCDRRPEDRFSHGHRVCRHRVCVLHRRSRARGSSARLSSGWLASGSLTRSTRSQPQATPFAEFGSTESSITKGIAITRRIRPHCRCAACGNVRRGFRTAGEPARPRVHQDRGLSPRVDSGRDPGWCATLGARRLRRHRNRGRHRCSAPPASRPYDVVVFLLTTGDVLNASPAGRVRGVHPRRPWIRRAALTPPTPSAGWPWYGRLVGAWSSGHPEIQSAGPPGRQSDPTPRQPGFPPRWTAHR